MKINWGTSIVIAFALFISFILFFVFKVQSSSKYDSQLVTDDYYKQELAFSKQMNKEQNAHDLIEKVKITKTVEGITVDFPKEFDINSINGKVYLYRPSNQKLDFVVPIAASSAHLLIPKKSLVDGLWNISVDWNYKGKEYLEKQSIIF